MITLCPIRHPKRYARQRDAMLAERIKALAPSLYISTIAQRVGISRMEAEEICARHGIHFRFTKEK